MLIHARALRSLGFTVVWLVILLAVASLSRARGSTIAAHGDPRIAAADAALARLVGSVDMTQDRLDPRVVELTERRRELVTDLNDRLTFWASVRSTCTLLIVVTGVLGAFDFVVHWVRAKRDGHDLTAQTPR